MNEIDNVIKPKTNEYEVLNAELEKKISYNMDKNRIKEKSLKINDKINI